MSKPLVIDEAWHACENPGCIGGKVDWYMWRENIRYCSLACAELAALWGKGKVVTKEVKSDENRLRQIRTA